MSVVKSYSDARKELERIASQRKHFFTNSKNLRGEMSSHRSPSPISNNTYSADRRSQISPGYNFNRSAESTPLFNDPSSNHRAQYQLYSASSSSSTGPRLDYRQEVERIIPSSHNSPSSGHYTYPNGIESGGFGLVSIPGLGTSSSVIGAFRQLQAKSRIVDQERSNAFKERDDLRRQVAENTRSREYLSSQSEILSSESFINMKTASDQLAATRNDLELQALTLQEISASTQRSNSSDRGVLLSLQSEISDIHALNHSLKCSNRVLEGEKIAVSDRYSRIETHSESSPTNRSKKSNREQAIIDNIENQIDSVLRSSQLAKMRCDALQKYMELILTINGDLSKKIADTVTARAHIRPKDLHHDCIANLVTDSAAEDLVGENEQRIANARAFLKIKRPLSAPINNLDRGDDGIYNHQSYPSYDDINNDNARIRDVKTNLEKSLERQGNEKDVQKGPRGYGGAIGRGERSIKPERFDLDAAYRALSGDPNKRKERTIQARASSASRSRGQQRSSNSTGEIFVRALNTVRSSSSPHKRSSSAGRPPAPVSYMVLDRHDSAYNQAVTNAAAAALSSIGPCDRIGFIPGGSSDAKEFNVMAKGSKIARATTHFNAAVAARVKAYKKDMIGDDLLDMAMG